MKITLEIPDNIAPYLEEKWGNLEKRALEILAVEAYRQEAITSAEVGRILNMPDRFEVDKFLKQEEAYLHYTMEDLEQDREAHRKLRVK